MGETPTHPGIASPLTTRVYASSLPFVGVHPTIPSVYALPMYPVQARPDVWVLHFWQRGWREEACLRKEPLRVLKGELMTERRPPWGYTLGVEKKGGKGAREASQGKTPPFNV